MYIRVFFVIDPSRWTIYENNFFYTNFRLITD
jgi:hypothetical protein